MSEPRHTLDEIQRWMQAVITHPAGPRTALESTTAKQQIALGPGQVEQVISRSRAQTSLERLEIYYHAYYARLLDCLRTEYSVLARALGDELFDTFAVGYLQDHPSTSYTLGQLGANFPEFLRATRPAVDDAPDTALDWPALMIDLARLERVVNEVFDGPGVERLQTLDLARLREIPADAWIHTRLVPAPCLRLLALSFPLNEFFTATARGTAIALPQAADSYLAITRRDYRVQRFVLSREQYLLLEALQEGASLGSALDCATRESSLTDDELAVRLQEWFHQWTAAGFFVELG
ncbi:MAG: putative DNA-binding domain-containing protein [Planctomycetes bacterium]|nr:putative DNA-binding domain-containing protein [Planctomycetota bacterium]